jgi:transcriptional regulator with XRE-family HTH domain
VDRPSIGNALRILREARGWSQSEAAARAGIARTTWGYWEDGGEPDLAKWAASIARGLGVPEAVLWWLEGSRGEVSGTVLRLGMAVADQWYREQRLRVAMGAYPVE